MLLMMIVIVPAAIAIIAVRYGDNKIITEKSISSLLGGTWGACILLFT